MSEYTKHKITDGFYYLEYAHMVRSFLFLGDQEAILVDTCMGAGDLKKEVESITDLPVTVVYTHGDKDHVGAADKFSKNLMHPSEFAFYAENNKNITKMKPLWEGDRIDIGTFKFEVILTPGHTPGSIMLLESDKRFVIGGDSIQRNGAIFMFGAGRSFESFQASMEKLMKRRDDFDVVYASHNQLELPPAAIDELYDAAGKMLTHSIEGVPEKRFTNDIKVYSIGAVSFFGV